MILNHGRSYSKPRNQVIIFTIGVRYKTTTIIDDKDIHGWAQDFNWRTELMFWCVIRSNKLETDNLSTKLYWCIYKLYQKARICKDQVINFLLSRLINSLEVFIWMFNLKSLDEAYSLAKLQELIVACITKPN